MRLLAWILPVFLLSAPLYAFQSEDKRSVQDQLYNRDVPFLHTPVHFIKPRDLYYLHELEARALTRDVTAFTKRNWALDNLKLEARHQDLGQVPRHDVSSERLVRRKPPPAKETVDVEMWDLAYMDLKTGDSRKYEISLDNGFKAKGQKATGTLTIKTKGLATCAALAIAGPGGALLGHFPPAFCDYLSGHPEPGGLWKGKAPHMKEKLMKMLVTNKAALNGGHAYVITGYKTQGDTAANSLQHFIQQAGLTVQTRTVQSQFEETLEARTAVIQKNSAGQISLFVDGRPV